MSRNNLSSIDLLALRVVIHAWKWPLKTHQAFSFIDFKDIVSAQAIHAKSKMMLFMSGPLQGFTLLSKFCIQLARRRK